MGKFDYQYLKLSEERRLELINSLVCRKSKVTIRNIEEIIRTEKKKKELSLSEDDLKKHRSDSNNN